MGEKNMYKELEQFNAEVAKADEQANKAEHELTQKAKEKAELEKRYQELVENNGKLAEIAQIKRSIGTLDDEILTLQDIVRALDKKRIKNRNSTEKHQMLRPVREAFEREIEATNSQLEPVIDEFKSQLAKTFPTLLKANDIFQEASRKNRELTKAELQIGFRPTHSFHVTDVRAVLHKYVEEAAMAYFNGQVPEWVQEYTNKQ
jgi:chromosome segregation ATPase